MAFGPALGSWITATFSLDALFHVSSMFALISIAILYNMKETLPKEKQEKFTLNSLKINRNDMFDPMVLPAAIVVFLTSFSYGAIVTLAPDLTKSIGLKNKGVFFLIYTLSSLFVRVVAGKFSDRNGRILVLRWACMVLIGGMMLPVFASNIYTFVSSAILFGLALGVISPITQAWTVDLCEGENRGRALATMYISLEAGIGLGAFFSAWIYGNDASRFPIAFAAMGSFSIIALIYLYSPKIRAMKAKVL
jgi:MFS family permease